MSSLDDYEVETMIDAYYKAAGLSGWRGKVNDDVAAVFGDMVIETKRCSEAMSWVPRPIGGKATVRWLVHNLGRGFIDRLRDTVSYTCLRGVIHRMGRELDRASILG